MKKVSFILFFALLLGMQFAFAQDPNSKVVTGVIAYEGNRYDEAITKLTEALGKSDLLKPKNVPKTHYFLMQSYIRVLSGDNALKAKFPDAEDKACESLIKLKETKSMVTGSDLKTYENGIALAEQQLWVAVFNKGAEAYGKAAYPDALKYLSRANQLAPDNYMSPFMLGFAQIMTKDSMAAKTSWEKCIDLYTKTQTGDKSKVDSNMVNVYLNLANIYTVKEGNVKALKMVQDGLTRFPKNPDLEITELSIYQRDPSLLQEALTKFEEATKKNPNDEKIFVAYASLLEKAGREKDALGVYEQVLQKSPDNLYANLNTGAYYVNKAAAVKKEMDAAGDNEKLYKEKYDEVKGNLAKAYPFMVKVHQKEPTNIEWVNQLVSITSYLMLDGKEMEEAFNKYVKLQADMRKK